MSKVLLVQILLVGLVCSVTSEVELEEISAPVVPNGSSDKYNFGQCELTTNGSFDAGQFSVNVTFDSEFKGFKLSDNSKWEKIDQSKYNWYFYVTKFDIVGGESFTIDFRGGKRGKKGKKGKGKHSDGSIPSGTCFGAEIEQECIVDVDFGGIRVETDGAFVGRGVCVFTVQENVTAGNLNVNVTFDDAILTFSNRDVLNLTSSSAGNWYFSESLVDYFVGDVLTYVFDVEWDTVNFPKGTCLANIACDDVIPTTTTTTTTGQPLPPVD